MHIENWILENNNFLPPVLTSKIQQSASSATYQINLMEEIIWRKL